MTDVVYSVRGGDGWDLRMSLRSRAVNMAGIGRIIVAGEPPDWLSDEVVRVPCASPFDRKQKNILHAVVTAIRAAGVRGTCLYSSDDHFVMAPFDAGALPWFSRCGFWSRFPTEASLLATGRALTPWRGSMVATGDLLRRHGMSDENWSGHYDTHLRTEDLDDVLRLAEGWESTPFGYEPSSLFIAVARTKTGVRGTPIRDSKTWQDMDPAVCEAFVRGSGGYVSVAESSRTPMFRRWMEARFPEPCRWEKA